MVFGRKSGVEADASWTTERSTDARKTLRTGFPPLHSRTSCPGESARTTCLAFTARARAGIRAATAGAANRRVSGIAVDPGRLGKQVVDRLGLLTEERGAIPGDMHPV